MKDLSLARLSPVGVDKKYKIGQLKKRSSKKPLLPREACGFILTCNRPFLECGVSYGWGGLFPLFDLLQKHHLGRLQK
jgi:hypothetical protein